MSTKTLEVKEVKIEGRRVKVDVGKTARELLIGSIVLFDDGLWEVEIAGNTYAFKEQLKKFGCRWNSLRRAWMLKTKDMEHVKKLAEICDVVVAIPIERVAGELNIAHVLRPFELKGSVREPVRLEMILEGK